VTPFVLVDSNILGSTVLNLASTGLRSVYRFQVGREFGWENDHRFIVTELT